MLKITMKVEGMMCGMCENHVNDAVRRTFPKIKKVTSSHSKGETVILTGEDIADDALRSAVSATGYTVGGISRSEEAEKKGLFSFLHRG